MSDFDGTDIRRLDVAASPQMPFASLKEWPGFEEAALTALAEEG